MANVANPANVANAVLRQVRRVANPANGANGALRQAAVPPRRDAGVLLWPGLFAADSLSKGIGKMGLESSEGARKRFPSTMLAVGGL